MSGALHQRVKIAAIFVAVVVAAYAANLGCNAYTIKQANDRGFGYGSSSYWYCWDNGVPAPHHLGHPVKDDHLCTQEDVSDPRNLWLPMPNWWH